MMRQWGHGHSFGAGALLAASFLSGHVLIVVLVVFLAGLALGRGWYSIGVALGRLPVSMRRWRAMRRRVDLMRPDDRVPF